jgi:hypothetical protein
MTEPTDEALRGWLLGKLPAAEAEGLERRVLADDAFGARLAEAEADLLDDLAAERLAGDERAAALARFTATPRARLRWRIARALARFARPETARVAHRGHSAPGTRHVRRRRGWIVGAFGAAAAVAIAVAGLNLRSPSSGTQMATITLLADRQRGAESEAIAVPRAARTIRLQVEVDADAPDARYALDVEEAGRVVFNADALVARTAGPYRFVEAVVPKDVLAPREHTVRVRATGTADSRTWVVRVREE